MSILILLIKILTKIVSLNTLISNSFEENIYIRYDRYIRDYLLGDHIDLYEKYIFLYYGNHSDIGNELFIYETSFIHFIDFIIHKYEIQLDAIQTEFVNQFIILKIGLLRDLQKTYSNKKLINPIYLQNSKIFLLKNQKFTTEKDVRLVENIFKFRKSLIDDDKTIEDLREEIIRYTYEKNVDEIFGEGDYEEEAFDNLTSTKGIDIEFHNLTISDYGFTYIDFKNSVEWRIFEEEVLSKKINSYLLLNKNKNITGSSDVKEGAKKSMNKKNIFAHDEKLNDKLGLKDSNLQEIKENRKFRGVKKIDEKGKLHDKKINNDEKKTIAVVQEKNKSFIVQIKKDENIIIPDMQIVYAGVSSRVEEQQEGISTKIEEKSITLVFPSVPGLVDS